MWRFEKNPEALRIYFEEYDFKNHEFNTFEDFLEARKEADIYGIYLDGELNGCIYFTKKDFGHLFHLAIKKEARGRWLHYYKSMIEWIKKNYSNVYTAAKIEDNLVNKLLICCGFDFFYNDYNFNWYKL